MATLKYKDPTTGDVLSLPLFSMYAGAVKELWSGSAYSGTINVPGLSNYEAFLIQFYYGTYVATRTAGSDMLVIGGLAPSSTAGWSNLTGAIFSISGDDLTITNTLHIDANGTIWYQCAANDALMTVTKIWGIGAIPTELVSSTSVVTLLEEI